MKKFQLFIFITAAATFASCEKDNYDPPTTVLSGKLVYQGEAIGVERNAVPFEIYQYGFGKVGPIGQSFAQDGTYSSLLYNGQYKFVIPNGQGPFMVAQKTPGVPDSLDVNLNGNQSLDITVTPYYMIRNPQVTGSAGKVNATMSLEKIITDANAKNIANVTLFINKTQFVSGADNIASANIAGADITDPANVSLSVDVPAITPTQNYVFARVALQVDGVEDRLFSPLVKIQF